MTGVRQSIVFQIEDNFGEGNPVRTDSEGLAVNYWVAAPPGTYFTSTHRRDTKRIQSMGSKFWDTVAFGPLSGTWEWSFYLDYNYPEPLFLIFEGGYNTNVRSRNVLQFTKHNDKRIPSFCIRRKLLNSLINGAENEMTILKGCVVTNATFSKPSNASYLQVRMTGFYASEELYTFEPEDMDKTDYTEYEGNLVEYGCLTSAELTDADENNASLIQNTDSVAISIANSAEAIYNTCAPFATNYSEGISKIQFSASSYSNHPSYYQSGVLTGGQRFNRNIVGKMYAMAKGAAPLHDAYLTSYNAMARDTGGIIGLAYAQSTRSSEIHLRDVVMAAITRQKGDNGKLMDSVSNCPVRKLTMVVKSTASQPFISTLSVNADSWKDLFYSVADRDESGEKTRVNNVIAEYPEIIIDKNGIQYEIAVLGTHAYVSNAPAGLDGNITLLSTVTSPKTGQTYDVTEIGSLAFENRISGDDVRPVNITTIKIPQTVTKIGNGAFRNVTTLQSISITGRNIKEIGDYAFSGCTSLAHGILDVRNSIEKIGVAAFANTNLLELYISDDIKEISVSSASNIDTAKARGAFANMSNLRSVHMPIQLNPIRHRESIGYYDAMFYGSDGINAFYFTWGNEEMELPDYSSSYIIEVAPRVNGEEGLIDYIESYPEDCPFLYTPWHRCVNNVHVSITLSSDITQMPSYMFYRTPAEFNVRTYSISLLNLEAYTEIGDFAFARSGLNKSNIRLNKINVVGIGAFINVGNYLSNIRITSPTFNKIPHLFISSDSAPTAGTSSVVLDLDECVRTIYVDYCAFNNIKIE